METYLNSVKKHFDYYKTLAEQTFAEKFNAEKFTKH